MGLALAEALAGGDAAGSGRSARQLPKPASGDIPTPVWAAIHFRRPGVRIGREPLVRYVGDARNERCDGLGRFDGRQRGGVDGDHVVPLSEMSCEREVALDHFD